jgi:hypothetical protein
MLRVASRTTTVADLGCLAFGSGRSAPFGLHEIAPFGYSGDTRMHAADLYRVILVCR